MLSRQFAKVTCSIANSQKQTDMSAISNDGYNGHKELLEDLKQCNF